MPQGCDCPFEGNISTMTGAPKRAFQLVVAASRNWGIGVKGGLLFKLPGGQAAPWIAVNRQPVLSVYCLNALQQVLQLCCYLRLLKPVAAAAVALQP